MAKGRRSENNSGQQREKPTGELPPSVKLLRTLEGHEDTVRSVSFDPSGGMLASAGDDGRVILWAMADGKRLRTLNGHKDTVRSVSFSSFHRRLSK